MSDILGDDDDQVSFSLGIGPHSVQDQLYFEPIPMHYSDLVHKYPQRRHVSGVSVAFYEYNMENFGHVLMDQLLPIFALLESFGLEDQPIQPFRYTMSNPLPWNCDFHKQDSPDRKDFQQHCRRFYDIFPKFLPSPHHPMEVFGNGIRSNQTLKHPICFETLAVGMPMYSDDCLEKWHGRIHDKWQECNHGKQALIWKYRNYVLRNLGIANVTQPPRKHKITITKRQDEKRGIANFDEIVRVIQETYKDSDVDVVVVEWHKLSLQDQFELIRTTTVHLTPPGGVSMMAVFLPRWATSIRLYTSEWKLDWHFLNYVSYITTEHVACRHEQNCPIDAIMARVAKGIRQYDSFLSVGRSRRDIG